MSKKTGLETFIHKINNSPLDKFRFYNKITKQYDFIFKSDVHQKINQISNNTAIKSFQSIDAKNSFERLSSFSFYNPLNYAETSNKFINLSPTVSEVLLAKISQVEEQLNNEQLSTSLWFRDYNLFTEDIEVKEQDIIIKSREVERHLKEIYTNNEFLYKLKSRKFEEVIQELLFHKGFEVELTGETRDGGYDIVALKDIAGFPVKFLVECKRYSKHRPVGISFIRSFCDVIKEENANKGIIVTTSYFSPESEKRQKKEGHALDLVDRLKLIEWVNEYHN